MMDKVLITQDDIRIYRPTAELDEAQIVPYIKEAQEQDLRPVLNNALYYDFLLKFDDAESDDYEKYNELLIGKAWTYNALTEYFNGVRPMLCYHALARFVLNNPMHITRTGVMKKLTTQSEAASPQEIQMIVREMRSAAVGYQNDVIRFLENNTNTYALYNTGGASSNLGSPNSFRFSKL